MEQKLSLGIDIGSTTAKVVLLSGDAVLYHQYRRHLSRVRETAVEMLRELQKECRVSAVPVMISGSAGLGLAEASGLPFVQEVYATGEVVAKLAPDTGAVIELGGEDAKVIFFDGGVDERMNGTCAGGTGAFIDQMAVLLDMTTDEMDAASLQAERIYPIASRCGVFAKTDIQPLLNQGARKADIAASIYQAVVNQTITGLVQGRRLRGKVMFLGGSLYYCEGLKRCFRRTLKLTDETALFPPYALYAVALGAAQCARNQPPRDLDTLIGMMEESVRRRGSKGNRMPPLFEDKKAYEAFLARHQKAAVPTRDIAAYSGGAWLGIDCGSTTTKLALIAEDCSLLYTWYSANRGNPVALVKEQLAHIYDLCGERIRLCGSAVTGYGEDLIRHAFHIDEGVVETIAHYTAAKHFQPDVDFILDIGGQDIKCFRIRDGAIDSVMLNEACSSGCGSFIETFARAMGYSAQEFARLGVLAKAPVDLGSRCTVFMNSSVKQSQKDGASVEDISAGLSVSVVKNAVYKVIRAVSPKELGEKIVVQGGTFYNDAVLRAFEQELGADVIRPSIAGLMGAYGAALHCMRRTETATLTPAQLADFRHDSSSAVCKGCENHCHITVNRFADGGRFISGNRCQKALGGKPEEDVPNLHEWKRARLRALTPVPGNRGTLGIPMALSTYELAPLWYALFTALGFEVHFSRLSTRATYERGQFSIPSDTVCYPAKLMHGHIMELLESGVSAIFYPGLTYNIDEGASDNHYNCPVVAYYGELLYSNMDALHDTRFLHPHLRLETPRALTRTLYPCLRDLDKSITKRETARAVEAGFAAYSAYRREVQQAGEQAVAWARAHGRRVMVLAGRPYHVDPEIGHGIDKLAGSLGFVVVSEDSVCHLAPVQQVHVLDQWTFHARLYRAAAYAAAQPDTELVQLVSFGCGVDAITTDEVRAILERRGRYYTQLKIDEITNLSAVRIRLRSLLGALEDSQAAKGTDGKETARLAG